MPEETVSADPAGELDARTAGQEDHEDPDRLRGGEADPPRDPDQDIYDGPSS